MNITLLSAAVTSAIFCGNVFAEQAEWIVPDLKLGSAKLQQAVEHKALATGVDFYDIIRGKSANEEFLLSSGVVSEKDAANYKSALKKLNIKYSIENAPEAAPNGKQLDKIVRVRGFSDEESAKKLSETLTKKGLGFSVRFSAQDGYKTNGPFHISLLRIDLNEYQGKVKSVLAKDKLQGAETTSSMAERNNAIAAINGGYFAFNDEVGDYGAPAGIYVKDGVLLREAANQRPVLIVDNSGEHSKVQISTSVETKVTLNVNNKVVQIDGVNRKPGIILNCGGFDDAPTIEALHDFVCVDESEIIVYDSNYGESTPKGEGVEIEINELNQVASVSQSRGVEIKDGYRYIQLTGKSKLSVKAGDIVVVDSEVLVNGKPFELKKGVSMVNAGPSLVSNFEIDKSLRMTQGFNPYPQTNNHAGSQDDDGLGVSGATENREGFYNGWVLRRHPRTAMGVTENNVVYAAVVYGRAPEKTEGANISDMSLLMKSLNVKDAINLDGGGSSMMIVEGKTSGMSSDSKERMVSDSIVFTK